MTWTPLLDPLPVDDLWWVLLIPIAALLAAGYKGVRAESRRTYVREVIVMTGLIVTGMVALGAASLLLTEVLLPLWR